MTTLSPLPPTPTPEPEREQPTPRTQPKKPLPFVVRMVWRPILAVVVALHALLLFTPLERSKPKPSPTPTPIDKNVKIDRISLIKKPPAPKPKPKTTRRPKANVKPKPRPRRAPAPKPSPTPPPETSDVGSPGPEKPPEDKPDQGGGDPCDWATLVQSEYLPLAQTVPPAEPDQFRQPSLYYEGGAKKAIVAEIVPIPLTSGSLGEGNQEQRSIETVERDLRKACDAKQANFQTVKEVGTDILYYVRKEGQPGAYVTLAKSKPTAAVIFLVLWAKDPTEVFR
ncbi:MAG: hypothetical protein NZ772_16325 [Cyanobacteria bacterium]|nr:hypothetical protein [Cyanobacteriota bacterium]MDW8202902.1 hypothetical protein [Cyanobacteriota bacterium SKYGB_h_bin112]